MKNKFIIAFVAISCITLLGYMVFNLGIKENWFSKNSSLSNKANNFILYDLNGNEITLNNYLGKKVFVNFWASWCEPCKAEMPAIEKIYQEYKDKDLVILAINIGENKKTVERFITDNKYNFQVLLDPKGKIAEEYNVSAIPVSYFINENGDIVNRRVGSMKFEEMKNYIQLLEE